MKTVAQNAIARSVSHNEITVIDHDTEALEELLLEADDSAETEEATEFWGTDDDGNEWRVHVRTARRGQAARYSEPEIRTIHRSDLLGPLQFLTPGKNQGQIVEVSYAGTSDGNVIKRVHDGSDRTTEYYIGTLTDDEVNDPSPIGLNHEPEIEGEWERVEFVD